MARSRSSSRWLREHFDDPYVHKARAEGYRSRAVYKLQEIHERERLLRPGQTVVDLGAAPGGWSQFASRVLAGQGRVVALDCLPMQPIAGVDILTGDFRESDVLAALCATLGDRPVDVVLSDMAPNSSGVKAVDQPRGLLLNELALELAGLCLRSGGDLLMKVFQGEGFDALLRELRARFVTVKVFKPVASRARSPEQYLLARNHRFASALQSGAGQLVQALNG